MDIKERIDQYLDCDAHSLLEQASQEIEVLRNKLNAATYANDYRFGDELKLMLRVSRIHGFRFVYAGSEDEKSINAKKLVESLSEARGQTFNPTLASEIENLSKSIDCRDALN